MFIFAGNGTKSSIGKVCACVSKDQAGIWSYIFEQECYIECFEEILWFQINVK